MVVKSCYFYIIQGMKQTFDYTVIYSDEDIVVLNKRSGLLIAADRYDPDAPRLDLCAEKEFGKLFAVHRIDKDTSGIVIYARNAEAHRSLSMQFENREVQKTYHCLVNGHPLWDDLHVDLKLMPDGDFRHRTVVNKRFGKPSVTDFHLFGNCGPYSWIEAKPHTGRTHRFVFTFRQITLPSFAIHYILEIRSQFVFQTLSANGTETQKKNVHYLTVLHFMLISWKSTIQKQENA